MGFNGACTIFLQSRCCTTAKQNLDLHTHLSTNDGRANQLKFQKCDAQTMGINQRNLKIWADMETKYAFAIPKNFGVGVDFRQCSEGDILIRLP